MRTGRKSRRKNRKSRGYIVPMCLALSGTLMAGTATAAEPTCLGIITNTYENPQYDENDPQWVKVENNTVTLHNIGISNGGWDTNYGGWNNRPNIPDYYYFTGVDADKKSIIVKLDESSNEKQVRPLYPLRSNSKGNSPYKVLIKAKNFTFSSDFDSNSKETERRFNNRGLFADEYGSITVDVSEKIDLKTGEIPIFANLGSITITGFKELKAEATGRMDGSGYVVRNVTVGGKPSTIQILGSPDSNIKLR